MPQPHSPAVYASVLAEAKRLHMKGEFKRSRVLYEDLALRHPDEPRPQLLLAELDVRDGRLVTARRRLEALAAHHPTLQEVRTALAGVAEELGEMTLATGIYQADAERAPDDAHARLRLATALRSAGRLAEAGGAYRRFISKWPDATPDMWAWQSTPARPPMPISKRCAISRKAQRCREELRFTSAEWAADS